MDTLEKIIAKMMAIPQKPLNTLVFSVLLIFALYLAAQITWKLVPASSTPVKWMPTPINRGASQTANLNNIKNLSLFGKVDAANSKKPADIVPKIAKVTDAPKTSLSISLTGVVASSTEKNGLAVIESRGAQNTYSLGDKIKGTSASLKEVYADRVIITNAGRYETLMLDGLKYNANGDANTQLQAARSNKPLVVDQRGNDELNQEIERSRDEMLANPDKISDYLAISPVRKEDGLVGYRLNSGKNRALFDAAGFKANDLAKSINGYDLTDVAQSLEVMSQLGELTDISVIVEREGQLVDIAFSLPQ